MFSKTYTVEPCSSEFLFYQTLLLKYAFEANRIVQIQPLLSKPTIHAEPDYALGDMWASDLVLIVPQLFNHPTPLPLTSLRPSVSTSHLYSSRRVLFHVVFYFTVFLSHGNVLEIKNDGCFNRRQIQSSEEIILGLLTASSWQKSITNFLDKL